MKTELKNVEKAMGDWVKAVIARDEVWREMKKYSGVMEKIKKKKN